MFTITIHKETKICYTVKDVIEFLSQFPENTSVECGWDNSIALVHGVNKDDESEEVIMFITTEDLYDNLDDEDEEDE